MTGRRYFFLISIRADEPDVGVAAAVEGYYDARAKEGLAQPPPPQRLNVRRR